MARRRYLITYDVSDDRRRNRLFSLLTDHGDHAQFSVFFCDLNDRELASLRGRMRETIHDRQDQVLILDLGIAAGSFDSGLECLGRAFHPVSRVLIV